MPKDGVRLHPLHRGGQEGGGQLCEQNHAFQKFTINALFKGRNETRPKVVSPVWFNSRTGLPRQHPDGGPNERSREEQTA